MVNVDFQEENNNWTPLKEDNVEVSGEKGLVGFLLRKKIIKNKKQANYVLFTLAGLFFLAALFFVFKGL